MVIDKMEQDIDARKKQILANMPPISPPYYYKAGVVAWRRDDVGIGVSINIPSVDWQLYVGVQYAGEEFEWREGIRETINIMNEDLAFWPAARQALRLLPLPIVDEIARHYFPDDMDGCAHFRQTDNWEFYSAIISTGRRTVSARINVAEDIWSVMERSLPR